MDKTPQQRKRYNADFYKTHREEIRNKQAQYYQLHSDELKEKQRRRYDQNRRKGD